jgi:hypothetical protein
MHILVTIALLSALHIDDGPYAGAYRVAPGGAVNWYFATTALLRLRRLPVPQTRAYLEAYLSHLDPYEGIADVLPMSTGIYAPIAPDSEDAYAATLLSLAARYRIESHDDAWWRQRVGTLSSIAYAKLLTQFKADGLIRASRTDATGYLMDNVEDYTGLRMFADALRATQGTDAHYIASFVGPLGTAIHRLYDPTVQAFRWSDSDPLGPLEPYPACAAQLFPQLFGVSSGRPEVDEHDMSGARQMAARCHFSLDTGPHEALFYALYIAGLHDRTPAENAFLRQARAHREASDDIVTLSLIDALGG